MKYRRIGLIASVYLQCTGLFAGDVGPIGVSPNYSGFYAGLGSGFTSLFSTDDFTVTRPGFGTIRLGDHKTTSSAVLFTGQVGYGAMLNNKTYLGAKGSVYYTPMENDYQIGYSGARGATQLVNGQDTFSRDVKPIYNIDAVLGYECFHNFLPFVEAGVSFANIKHNFAFEGTLTDLTTPTIDSYSGSTVLNNYKTGFNVGLGANYLYQTNWVLSGELVYHDLGKQNIAVTNSSLLGTTSTHNRQEFSQAVSLLATVSYLMPC